MNRSVMNRGQEMDFLYLCRAIFHDQSADGIRMPFFSN
ncbi:RAxF-45 family protein [Bacillus marinisedimentorum]|nr:RAxF-45 family protein [Bacillus marinisedimentorum]